MTVTGTVPGWFGAVHVVERSDGCASVPLGADRLQAVSYGEERPKHDNSREETRRLNRRAALLVRVTK